MISATANAVQTDNLVRITPANFEFAAALTAVLLRQWPLHRLSNVDWICSR